jgi:hypothetical protein
LAFLRTRPRTQFKTGPKALICGSVRREAEDRPVAKPALERPAIAL